MEADGTTTKNVVATQVNEGFTRLEQLWQNVEGIEEIHGLDSSSTSQIKKQINSAYESMREVQRTLGSA